MEFLIGCRLKYAIISVVFLVLLKTVTSYDEPHPPEYYLDRCLAGIKHKEKPGPESSLFGQCSSWKDESCCTDDVVREFHIQSTWYGFNWNHCGDLSKGCRDWLLQDLCFYECSPNVGPWLVPHDISIRDERFLNVPLCKSECNLWFEACKDDLTCKDNWSKGWNWTTGTNVCPTGSTCTSFVDIFGTADNFCQNLWGGSFKVVNDTEPCMALWFNNGENPNKMVAVAKAEELSGSAARLNLCWIIMSGVFIILTIFLER